MNLKRTNYDYVTYRNKTDFYEITKGLELIYSGQNIKTADLTRGKDGKYSESALIILINKMMQVYNFDKNDSEYMKHLLYVVIRSLQTEIKGVLPNPGISDSLAEPLSDTLKTLSEVFNPRRSSAGKFVLFSDDTIRSFNIPVSLDISNVACTLYTMFTGKILPFPNPYEKEYIMECKKKGIIPYSEEPEDYDFSLYEDFEDYGNQTYYTSNYDPEGEKDITPPQSRTLNKENYTIPGIRIVQSEEELYPKTKYYPNYPSVDDKNFKKERDRILLSFPHKESFVRSFEYLVAHNSSSFCEIEGCVHTMIEQLLLNYNVSLFADAENFGEAFYHLKHALDVAKEVIGKRYGR